MTTPAIEKPVIEKEVIAPTSLSDTDREQEQQSSMEMALSPPDLQDLGAPEYEEQTQTQYFWPAGQRTLPNTGVTAQGNHTPGWPVQGRVSSGYGQVRPGIRDASGYHGGVDIAVPVGTPVVAPIGGTVLWAKWAGTYGNAMLVQMDDGHSMLVAHLSGFRARPGQRVNAGQTIALSGNTGNSTGPHVHWEIRTSPAYGDRINPMDWLERANLPSTPAPSSSRGGTGGLAGLAQSAGFTPQQARIMAAIAMAESSGNPRAHNPNARTGDNSYGLWQINMLGSMGPERRRLFGIRSNEQLFDPATNARAAYSIFRQQGFNAWSVYRSGAYRRYLT